ncbi:MAG: bifunctional riboflavin kinase/FAD synthetase [Eubacteriales bacterium]
MELIKETKEFNIEEKTAIAIGKFDGIHKGHQKIFRNILDKKAVGYKTAVFTFDPPATAYFSKKKQVIKELSTREEKRKLFEEIGIDYVVEYPLDEQTAKMLPEDFIKNILLNQMNMGYLAAGEDVSYGYEGRGNATLLTQMSMEYEYCVEIIPKVFYQEEIISSTLIRNKVKLGEMEVVNHLLGRNYSYVGEVVKGNQLGRTIQMPTANIIPDDGKLLVPNGVYFSKVKLREGEFYGVTNVGYKPTVTSQHTIGIETYLFDVNADLYGEIMQVSLLRYKRAEYKFTTFAELTSQMQKDREDARKYFGI